jgi:ribose-phosphate pyrophosphokinase
MIFSGSSHPTLAREVAKYLGLELQGVRLETFPDGEIFVQVDESVRGRDTFVIQSIARRPNFNLMELLVLIDALKRASARSIVAVLPYYGYARQDRKDAGRVPITAKLVADLLQTAGATRVVTMDLHAAQIQGFFDVPVDNLFGRPVLVEELRGLGKEVVVACPDIGSVKIARRYADALGLELRVVDKRRLSSDEVAVTTLIGDVKGRTVLFVDDMVSTGGTLVAAAQAVMDAGAKRVVAAVTHGLLVGDAIERIEASPIEQLLVTDTVPNIPESPKVRVVSVAHLFGEVINRIVSARPVSPLFQ